jgi:hypothetical protein
VSLAFVDGVTKIINDLVPTGPENEAGILAVQQLFVEFAPAYSAAKMYRSRKDGGRAGYMGYETPLGIIATPREYTAAIEDRLNTTVHTIANMRYRSEFSRAAKNIADELEVVQRSNRSIADKSAALAFAKELGKRINFAKSPQSSRVAYHIRGGTFVMTLGLLPAAVLNQVFQIPMVILPHLLGNYRSIGGIMRTMRLASSIIVSSGNSRRFLEPGATEGTTTRTLDDWGTFENYYEIDQNGDYKLRTDKPIPAKLRKTLTELAPLARYMAVNGMLGHTIAQAELSDVTDIASKAYRFSGLGMHYIERYVRQTTAISTFLLEQEKIRKAKGDPNYQLSEAELEATAKLAADTTELTNGTVGPVTGPSIAMGGFGSVVTMYKRYAVTMVRYMATGMSRALAKPTPDMTPEQVEALRVDRAIARYQLATMLGSTMVFAGVQGLPFFEEIMSVLDMAFTDDEEDDFSTMVQKSLQEPYYHGLMNYVFGAEIASRISFSGLIFRENKIEKNQSLLYDLIEMFGGPAVGTYFNIDRGFKAIGEGEIYRGIESIAPSAVRAGLRAVRYELEGGATTRRGDTIVETDGWDTFVQLMGYTPTAYARTQEATGREKRKAEAARSRKAKLYNRYNIALAERDMDEVRAVLADMREYARDYPEDAKFDLQRSAAAFRRRSDEMVGGVYIPEKMRPRAEASLSEYDPSSFE